MHCSPFFCSEHTLRRLRAAQCSSEHLSYTRKCPFGSFSDASCRMHSNASRVDESAKSEKSKEPLVAVDACDDLLRRMHSMSNASAVDDEATSESLGSCMNQCSMMADLCSSNESVASTDSSSQALSREMSRAGGPTRPESAANAEHGWVMKGAKSEKSQERLVAADACDDSDFFCSAVDLLAARSKWAPLTHTEWSRGGSAVRRLHLAREAHPWCHVGAG